MEITAELIGQGIVLAGLIAGFGLSVTAQIALGSDKSFKTQKVAYFFLSSSLGCVLFVVAALLMLALGEDHRAFASLGSGSLFVLLASLLVFLLGILSLADAFFSSLQIRNYVYLLVAFLVVFIVWFLMDFSSAR